MLHVREKILSNDSYLYQRKTMQGLHESQML